MTMVVDQRLSVVKQKCYNCCNLFCNTLISVYFYAIMSILMTVFSLFERIPNTSCNLVFDTTFHIVLFSPSVINLDSI